MRRERLFLYLFDVELIWIVIGCNCVGLFFFFGCEINNVMGDIVGYIFCVGLGFVMFGMVERLLKVGYCIINKDLLVIVFCIKVFVFRFFESVVF